MGGNQSLLTKGGEASHCSCCQNSESSLRKELETTLAAVRRTLTEKMEDLNERLGKEDEKEQLAKEPLFKRSCGQAKQRIMFALDELTGYLGGVDMKACIQSANNETLARARSELDCPVCYEEMAIGKEIWQCAVGHLVCGDCKQRPEVKKCPSCRGSFMGRAFAVERVAKVLFKDS